MGPAICADIEPGSETVRDGVAEKIARPDIDSVAAAQIDPCSDQRRALPQLKSLQARLRRERIRDASGRCRVRIQSETHRSTPDSLLPCRRAERLEVHIDLVVPFDAKTRRKIVVSHDLARCAVRDPGVYEPRRAAAPENVVGDDAVAAKIALYRK